MSHSPAHPRPRSPPPPSPPSPAHNNLLTGSPASRTNCLAYLAHALPGSSAGRSLSHSVRSPSLGPTSRHSSLSDVPVWPAAPPRQMFSPQEQAAPAPCPAESLGALCKQISSPCPDPLSVLDKGCLHGTALHSSTLPASTFLFSYQAGLGMKVSSRLAYLPFTSPCLIFFRVLCIITWDDLVFSFIVGLPPTPVLFTVEFLELCLGHSRHSINIW